MSVPLCYNRNMTPKLTDEMRQALEQSHGFLKIEGDGGSCIVMTMQVYRDMMGVATDEDLEASLKAIEQGHADVEAGRTRPFREVLAELGSDDAVHG